MWTGWVRVHTGGAPTSYERSWVAWSIHPLPRAEQSNERETNQQRNKKLDTTFGKSQGSRHGGFPFQSRDLPSEVAEGARHQRPAPGTPNLPWSMSPEARLENTAVTFLVADSKVWLGSPGRPDPWARLQHESPRAAAHTGREWQRSSSNRGQKARLPS